MPSYRILSLLGMGAFGRVYHARLEGSGRFVKDVALKMVHGDLEREMLARFRDEARILGLVRDRAVVAVDPPALCEGNWAFVMELVEGTSLRDLLDLGRPLPASVAAEVVEEIARALDHVYHQAGPDGRALEVLHRDLKPANVQLTPSGEVKILDFGVSRARFAGREAHTTFQIGGTAGYVAPERLAGHESPAGDVYSLGVLLGEVVTGEADPSRQEAVDEAGRAVLALVADMTRKRPGDRPTAREVEARCRALRREHPDPSLRDWAARAIPTGRSCEPDDRVGRLVRLVPEDIAHTVLVERFVEEPGRAAEAPIPEAHAPPRARKVGVTQMIRRRVAVATWASVSIVLGAVALLGIALALSVGLVVAAKWRADLEMARVAYNHELAGSLAGALPPLELPPWLPAEVVVAVEQAPAGEAGAEPAAPPPAEPPPDAATAEPPAPRMAYGDCGELPDLEALGMLAQLDGGQLACLRERSRAAEKITDRVSASLLLLGHHQAAMAEGAPCAAFDAQARYHLDGLDRSDPAVIYLWARHLYTAHGIEGAWEAAGWADRGLAARQRLDPQRYQRTVLDLYEVRGAGVFMTWRAAAASYAATADAEVEATEQRLRHRLKDETLEWMDFAESTGNDTRLAKALCAQAIGDAKACRLEPGAPAGPPAKARGARTRGK